MFATCFLVFGSLCFAFLRCSYVCVWLLLVFAMFCYVFDSFAISAFLGAASGRCFGGVSFTFQIVFCYVSERNIDDIFGRNL